MSLRVFPERTISLKTLKRVSKELGETMTEEESAGAALRAREPKRELRGPEVRSGVQWSERLTGVVLVYPPWFSENLEMDGNGDLWNTRALTIQSYQTHTAPCLWVSEPEIGFPMGVLLLSSNTWPILQSVFL